VIPDPGIQAIARGAEFRIDPPVGDSPTAVDPGSTGGGFGRALSGALDHLAQMQQSADASSQALALGQTTDVAGVAMDVERANLAMQLAVQVRNKAVDAYHEIFRMQI
jgi:flagellar hook-basal body complex protein FliE